MAFRRHGLTKAAKSSLVEKRTRLSSSSREKDSHSAEALWKPFSNIPTESDPMTEIIIYEDPGAANPVQVTLDGETVWLTQTQMAELFDRDRTVIAKHVRNIFKEEELDPEATCAKFARVQVEGDRSVKRETEHYNLDVIISVGYRIKSPRGVRFRQWATSVLKNHLLKGYSLNRQRLSERGLEEAQAALDLLARTLAANALVDDTSQAVVALIARYAKTWRLLLQYDENRVPMPEGCSPARGVLECDKAQAAIAGLKADLAVRGEATALFGQERENALAGILGNIEQTMFGEPLYTSREEKAAHLLYFVIKDHPFADGNKRIGAFLFLLYLQQEEMDLRMGDTALTALALLVAESLPKNKDLLIHLIVNLLAESQNAEA
jgi:prophage maintenance system killer protein